MSNFQKKLFFRRYYELDTKTKQLKIFEREGGALKDSVPCAVTHVVTCLKNKLRADYRDFLSKPAYRGLVVTEPEEYTRPFAVFMEDGSMLLLWAATEIDFATWT